jgi:hypothetical protein
MQSDPRRLHVFIIDPGCICPCFVVRVAFFFSTHTIFFDLQLPTTSDFSWEQRVEQVVLVLSDFQIFL